MASGPIGSGDAVTDERARAGVAPNLRGWKQIAAAIGDDVHVRTVQKWEAQGKIPVVSFGGRVAAYADRVLACLMSQPRRAA